MNSFSIETPDEAPYWLLAYQAAGREPEYRTADRWIVRTTEGDREQVEELADADGVEIEFTDGAVVSGREFHDDAYLQAAGEVFEEAHEDAAGDAVFVVEMQSCSMNLIKYNDGFLSWFDTGMIWLNDRFRVSTPPRRPSRARKRCGSHPLRRSSACGGRSTARKRSPGDSVGSSPSILTSS